MKIIAFPAKQEINDVTADEWFCYGVECELNGKINEAEKAYLKALDIDMNSWQANFNLGRIYLQQGHLYSAHSKFEKATVLNPENAESWFSLAYALADMGRHEDAITALIRAIDVDPDYADAFYNLALSCEELAKKCWRNFLKYDSSSDWAVRAREYLAQII